MQRQFQGIMPAPAPGLRAAMAGHRPLPQQPFSSLPDLKP